MRRSCREGTGLSHGRKSKRARKIKDSNSKRPKLYTSSSFLTLVFRDLQTCFGIVYTSPKQPENVHPQGQTRTRIMFHNLFVSEFPTCSKSQKTQAKSCFGICVSDFFDVFPNFGKPRKRTPHKPETYPRSCFKQVLFLNFHANLLDPRRVQICTYTDPRMPICFLVHTRTGQHEVATMSMRLASGRRRPKAEVTHCCASQHSMLRVFVVLLANSLLR